MQPKKNPEADLEKKRSLFFLIGMSIAIIAAIFVLQWQKEVVLSNDGERVYRTAMTDDDPIPPTIRTMPAPPEKVVEPKKPELPDPDKLIIAQNTATIDLNNAFNLDPEPTDLVPVDLPGEAPVAPPVVNVYDVQKVARPMGCCEVSGKDESQECLNTWIKAYLSKNVEYPELPRRMGIEEKLYVEFVISHTGEVEGVKVVRGENEQFIEEASRVISSFPKFCPASHMGRKVKMKMVVPIHFKAL